ncbi:hypothetical protein DFJ63DRAFT_321235 [Scheffersomyces coipomensis]|uniref:uncharacterized protein n=1 Tax=Scheffersomyces coipomensis TaxID=1788519 RepID=UPI00315DD130
MTDVNDIEDQIRIYRPSLGPSSPTNQDVQQTIRHIKHNDNDNDNDTTYRSVSEQSALLDSFPYSLVMKVSSSEPRDVLQSERTCLTFIRFSTSLFFTALGIIVNFKFNSSGQPIDDDNPRGRFNASLYSTIVSYVLLLLSLATLVLSGINYFITVQRYANHKINTYSFNNFSTVIVMTCVIITLIAISISLIVEGYLEQRE